MPPDESDDKAIKTALDLLRGTATNAAFPPNPMRRFITDEPDAVRSTNPGGLLRAFSGINPECTVPILELDSGLGRQYLSLETSPGKIFAAYLVCSSGLRPDCGPQEFFGATSRIIDKK